jgi:hypothetical protein
MAEIPDGATINELNAAIFEAHGQESGWRLFTDSTAAMRWTGYKRRCVDFYKGDFRIAEDDLRLAGQWVATLYPGMKKKQYIFVSVPGCNGLLHKEDRLDITPRGEQREIIFGAPGWTQLAQTQCAAAKEKILFMLKHWELISRVPAGWQKTHLYEQMRVLVDEGTGVD